VQSEFPTHLNEILTYDTARRTLTAWVWPAAAERPIERAFAAPAEIASAIANDEILSGVAPFAAAYGLAMTAAAWRGRPTDPTRGAITQAAETIRALPGDSAPLDRARAAADAALIRGEDPAVAIAVATNASLTAAARATDRCTRRIAELIDAEDRALLLLYDGAVALRMFAVGAPAPAALLVVARAAAPQDARFVAAAAGGIATIVTVQEAMSRLRAGDIDLLLVEAAAVAQNGDALAADAALAAAQCVPCYVAAPAGPHPEAEDGAALPAFAGAAHIPAPLISAIGTSRGLYRPAMLRRHFDNADIPPDVIPLF
jgi:hypothetical protein